MKVAMVSNFPEEEGRVTGGVESTAITLLQGLAKIPGIDLHVIAPASRKNGRETRGDLKIHWISYPKVPGFIGYWTLMRRDIQRTLKAIQPDIAHFQGVAGWSIGYPDPYVLTIHGIQERDVLLSGGFLAMVRSRIIAAVEKTARKQARDAIIISPYVEEVVGNQLAGRRWAIENPVPEVFFNVKRSPDRPRILFVGRIRRLKNIDGLIRSFSLVLKRVPSAELCIAGDSDPAYEAECRRLCGRLGIDHAVSFPGSLDRECLLEELARATCVALVSHQETAPMIVEEAMAAGLPVVASRICGLRYLVEDGNSGYLVDQNDEEEIADRICDLLLDDVKNAAFGQRGNTIARERFHVTSVTRTTWELYKIICEEW
jgi:glycosyltransferase involved in cell wall biosynthesis